MPNAESIDPLVVDRVLAGAGTDAERRAVEAWAAAHPSRAAYLDVARGASLDAVSRDWHTEAAVARLRARLDAVDTAGGTLAAPDVRRDAPSRVRRRVVAGVLGLAAAAAALLVGPALRGPETAVATTIATGRGEHREVRLDDGSTIVLGPMSRARYALRSRGRDVELSGVALFRVTHDARRPFVVRAGGAITEDVGTEFVVRAYPGDARMTVTVASGLVAVRAARASRPPVVLHAGEAALVDSAPGDPARDGVDVRRGVSAAVAAGWAEGRLTFDDVPLADVATELARWFDVEVRVPDRSLARRHVSAAYRDPTLDGVLAQLGAALGVRAARAGRVVTLLPEPAR